MKSLFKAICICMAFVCLFAACGQNTGTPGNSGNAENSQNSESSASDSAMNTDNSTQTPSAEPMTEDIVAPTENQGAKNDKMILTGENTGTSKTKTGFEPLEKVSYTVTDPNNKKGLSNKKVSHSHGPAAEGKPHHTVVEFQKHFSKFNSFTLDTTTKEKVLYLTFDCGYENNGLTGKMLDILKEKKVPAAFFCTLHHIKDQPELISRMIKEGHIVGNHSANHPSFPDISRTKMVEEIEECENYLRENFGYAAKFFRFPAGEYSDSALDAVNSIGYVSVFWSVAYSDWDTSNSKGRDYAIKTVMDRIHPGAVILLHSVSQDNADALGEIIDRARKEGYEFRSLDQYPQTA